MNRGPSPIFDVPEFPTLRRVKPLPKRRRMTATASPDGDDDSPPPSGSLSLPFPLPGPDATAEDLIAHAESFSAHMALQSYYMTGLDIFNRNTDLNGTAYGDGEDGEDGDEDGMEHLQQPGNTKKRKVPTNANASPGHDLGDAQSGGEDEPTERGIPTGRPEGEAAAPGETIYQPPPTSPFSGLGIRKGRPPRITLAGLQHKETLKTRKRQLAAVLGALSLGDTLALDQALSSHYPLMGAAANGSGFDPTTPLRVRISRRLGPRLSRAARFSEKYRHPDKRPFMECEFTYSCPCSTAERLVATKEEVAMLRERFEAELTRQATKAAKLAAANKLMSAGHPPAKTNRQKRSSGRTSTRAPRTSSGTTTTTTTTTTSAPAAAKGGPDNGADQAALMGVKPRNTGGGNGGGKKKKRSALANASNPHHLRNYVPSRLPHSGQPGNGGAQHESAFGPLPLRFLSADIPPRRRRGQPVPPPNDAGPVLTNPADEWICAFCEYQLFYGDDAQLRKAVRSRKKILRRRRRARERAAAAASGTSTAKAPPEKAPEEYDMHPGYAPGAPDDLANLPKQTKWRGEVGKDRERPGELGAVG